MSERLIATCLPVSRAERGQDGVARWDLIWTVIVEILLVLIWLCNPTRQYNKYRSCTRNEVRVAEGLGHEHYGTVEAEGWVLFKNISKKSSVVRDRTQFAQDAPMSQFLFVTVKYVFGGQILEGRKFSQMSTWASRVFVLGSKLKKKKKISVMIINVWRQLAQFKTLEVGQITEPFITGCCCDDVLPWWEILSPFKCTTPPEECVTAPCLVPSARIT